MLRTAALTIGNVSIRTTNVRRNHSAPGVIAGHTVTATMDAGFAQLGPDVADYFATPPDIVSARGGVALAFLNFPLT